MIRAASRMSCVLGAGLGQRGLAHVVLEVEVRVVDPQRPAGVERRHRRASGGSAGRGAAARAGRRGTPRTAAAGPRGSPRRRRACARSAPRSPGTTRRPRRVSPGAAAWRLLGRPTLTALPSQAVAAKRPRIHAARRARAARGRAGPACARLGAERHPASRRRRRRAASGSPARVAPIRASPATHSGAAALSACVWIVRCSPSGPRTRTTPPSSRSSSGSTQRPASRQCPRRSASARRGPRGAAADARAGR